jgi:hypothetical protein
VKGKPLSAIDINAIQSLMGKDKEALASLPQALDNLETGAVRLLAISGKKGSGKDTFTAALADELSQPFTIYAFAYALKAQAQDIFDIIGYLVARDYTEDMIVNDLIQNYTLWNIPFITKNMHELVQGITADLKQGITPDSYKRSPGAWRGLQLLGTDIRRRQDDNYWVKLTVSHIINQLAQGTSVYISDVRFPNEISSLEYFDAPTIRMHVTPEVQKQRLLGRDGTMPSEEALMHPSEVSLDDYGFEVIVDNNGSVSIAENVKRVSTYLRNRPAPALRELKYEKELFAA